MTSKLIFKMELFKFIKDRGILISAAVLAVINIILALVMNYLIGDAYHYSYDSSMTYIWLMSVPIFFLVLFGNFIFSMFLPFHMISVDYKNNVLATMVAAGVNRTKLFFSKIGAILLVSLVMMILLTVIPGILIIAKLIQLDSFSGMIEGIDWAIRAYNNTTVFHVVFGNLLSYLSSLVIIAAACILVKGRNLAFLLYIGLNIAVTIIRNILTLIPIALGVEETTSTGMLWYGNLLTVITIAIFGYLALTTMKRQNL